jgi:hypothetical protein
VYFLEERRHGLIKVGFTRGELRIRLNNINCEINNRGYAPVLESYDLRCLGFIRASRKMERTLHILLRHIGLPYKSADEWFIFDASARTLVRLLNLEPFRYRARGTSRWAQGIG